MRIFISWSGDLSKQLGEVIRNWLPSALQYVKPYFTPDDIDKGAKWATEISAELAASSVCIIVLTRENLQSSWIMFEAGAISKTLDTARVCPITFGIDPTDLQGPLAQFQVTRFLKEDVRKLFKSINNLAAEHKLDDSIAEAVFSKWWPDLEAELNAVLQTQQANVNKKAIRTDRALIEEILLTTRSILEKEQPKTPPAAPVKYENSINKLFVDYISYSVAESGLMSPYEMNTRIVDLVSAVRKRMPIGPMKEAILEELELLAIKSEPPPRKRRSTLPVEDDPPF